MHLKIYVPKNVEIPSEYLAAIAQRANDALGEAAKGTPATRGHLVRQAIRDGLLRELDELIAQDGKVDIYCDPHTEIPLEIDNHTVTLNELLSTLNHRRTLNDQRPDHQADMSDVVSRGTMTPKRKAA
jgi:hypothetical protein